MKTVILTGTAGFIGCETAKELIGKGYTVFGLDNLNEYYDITLKEHRLNTLRKFDTFSFYMRDIENYEDICELFEVQGIDGVIHLAARAGVRYSIIDPFVYFTTNTLGTLNLLELCKRYNVKKFVLASTSSLYAGQKMPFTESLPVNEPISPYAASKKGAEVAAYTYHFLHGLDVTVLRYFTVYGPAGRPDMSIFRFIKWIDEGSSIEMYGDGTQMRDFTYVEDIARGTVKAFETETGYEIINLGGNKPFQMNHVISLLEEYIGKKAEISCKPFHRADLKATLADITKAKNILDWMPLISLEEGLKRTVDWHKDNSSWIKDLHIDLSK